MAGLELKKKQAQEVDEPPNATPSGRSNHRQLFRKKSAQESMPTEPPSGKTRLSVDVKNTLYQRLRIHVAVTNSRINSFIEEMIEKHC